jgi:hypothetical protein
MTAKQYFSAIDRLRRDNVAMMDVWRWEMVPDQLLGNYEPVFSETKAWGGLFFADYQTPGDHRVGIGKSAHVCVVMGPDDIVAVTAEDLPEAPERVTTLVYPVAATALLNTDTPNTGMTQKDYETMRGISDDAAQKTPAGPQASLGEEQAKG